MQSRTVLKTSQLPAHAHDLLCIVLARTDVRILGVPAPESFLSIIGVTTLSMPRGLAVLGQHRVGPRAPTRQRPRGANGLPISRRSTRLHLEHRRETGGEDKGTR